MMLRLVFTALTLALAVPAAAHAENQISFYSGYQSAPHSTVTVTDHIDLSDTTFTAVWLGKPMAMPPYYGLRYTRWAQDGNLGWGVEFTHDKVYADPATLATSGFSHLEFSDGLNILTLNALRRWQQPECKLTPYAGAGLGIAVPHAEAFTANDHTFNYQYGGPALRWFAGASYRLGDRWSVFGEYQGTYSRNNVSFDTGGTLKTNIITNALNVGLSLSF